MCIPHSAYWEKHEKILRNGNLLMSIIVETGLLMLTNKRKYENIKEDFG